jgi:hypothetical protein
MWSLLPGTLVVAALTLAPPPGPSHPSIASLKANPAAVASQTFDIDGMVVDIRSTTPMGHSGLYRLVDASDTTGVLVQTADLPANGGAFRVKAKLAEGQPGGQLLSLVEIRRTPTDGRPRIPIVALVLSGLAVLVLAGLAVQAIREQRRYLLALPLWLLPYAAPSGKADKGTDSLPALRYEPELEVADRRHHVRLRNRKRGLLTAVGGATALTGLSALWVVSSRPAAPMIPTFVLLAADNSVPPPAPVPVPEAPVPEGVISRPDSGGDQTPTVRIAPPPPPPPPAIPHSTVAIAKKPVVRDSTPIRRVAPPPPPPVAPPAAPPPSRVTKSVPKTTPATVPQSSVGGRVTSTPPANSPPPAPPPPPPQAPPPPPTQPPPTAPTPVASPPARSADADRAEAGSVVRGAAARLVAAINAKQDGDLAQLLPEGQAGDRSRLTRFLKLIKDYGPRATLGTVDEPALSGDRAEARFSLSLSWRGDFGVSSRKSGTFLGLLRHTDSGWRFDGARLLDNLP